MAYVPPFSALDFHSTVFSLVFKSPIEWDPEKRRVVFTPSRRATPIWTVIAIGCEICLLQVLCGYLLISEFWWPEKSTLSSSQVMFQVIIVLLSAVQGVIAYIFWIYWDDWKFAFGQFVWLLERLERSECVDSMQFPGEVDTQSRVFVFCIICDRWIPIFF